MLNLCCHSICVILLAFEAAFLPEQVCRGRSGTAPEKQLLTKNYWQRPASNFLISSVHRLAR